MREQLAIQSLFDLDRTIAKPLFDGLTYPWQALAKIREFILALGAALDPDAYERVSETVWISKRARVFPSAFLGGPTVIDHDAEVRHCAFIRGSAIVGKRAVVGNSTELKNCILFDAVQVPHFNYVGDSILGYKAHMGAGAITSNVKSDKTLVCVKGAGEPIETGLKKFGAMLGDYVEVGCNSVLNPGCVIGRASSVYPTSSVRGFVPENSIVKDGGTIVPKRERTGD